MEYFIGAIMKKYISMLKVIELENDKVDLKPIDSIPIEWLRDNQEWLVEHLEVYEDKIEELINCWKEDK